uniref:Uncharacterized protein n=1 Tax=Amphimedon queenslandica TaxID=400682 RepID=A0A1X7U9Y3_AMPQE
IAHQHITVSCRIKFETNYQSKLNGLPFKYLVIE